MPMNDRSLKFVTIRVVSTACMYDQTYFLPENTTNSYLSPSGSSEMTVFVCSVREYWPTVDLRLVEPRSRRSDLTGEEANLTDRPALGEGVLKK